MASATQQPVIFKTSTPYPLPTQKYLLPTTWKRYHLSQLINKALSLSTPIPFDFIVKGEILKTSLGEWCNENGVGEEETLEVEYVESVLPPVKMGDIPHEDWASSILCDLPGYLLTASYDGHVRAFDYSKTQVFGAAIHSAPITSLTLIPSTTDNENEHMIATSSLDLTAAISKITLDASSSTSSIVSTLHLHTAPVTSVASNSSGTYLLTSSWDGLIGLWDTTLPTSDEVPESVQSGSEKKKRRKVEEGAKPKRKAPSNVLRSHTARVSKVVFGSSQHEKTAYSCGFDSTVRVWDVENGLCVHTITAAEKPFLDIAVSADGRNALATSTDRSLTLYDLRSIEQPAINASAGSFFHPATPSCIAISNNGSGNQVVTGAYDGVTRVWDLRSTKGAMASFKAFDGTAKKILDVDWKRGVVGIAGEGGVEIWKVGEEVERT